MKILSKSAPMSLDDSILLLPTSCSCVRLHEIKHNHFISFLNHIRILILSDHWIEVTFKEFLSAMIDHSTLTIPDLVDV